MKTAHSKPVTRVANLITPIILLMLITAGTSLHAAQLDLPDSPLFLRTQVAPNVFLQIDDSGSMIEEVLTRQHWYAFCYDSNAPDWAGGDWDCEPDWTRATDGYWYGYTGETDFFTNFGYIFSSYLYEQAPDC